MWRFILVASALFSMMGCRTDQTSSDPKDIISSKKDYATFSVHVDEMLAQQFQEKGIGVASMNATVKENKIFGIIGTTPKFEGPLMLLGIDFLGNNNNTEEELFGVKREHLLFKFGRVLKPFNKNVNERLDQLKAMIEKIKKEKGRQVDYRDLPGKDTYFESGLVREIEYCPVEGDCFGVGSIRQVVGVETWAQVIFFSPNFDSTDSNAGIVSELCTGNYARICDISQHSKLKWQIIKK